MPDEQSGERAAMRRIDRIKALGDAVDLIRAHTDKFIARELKQIAKRWGRRFLDGGAASQELRRQQKFMANGPTLASEER